MTTQKSGKGKSPRAKNQVFGWNLKGILDRTSTQAPKGKGCGTIIVCGSDSKKAELKKHIPAGVPAWENLTEAGRRIIETTCGTGPLLVVKPSAKKETTASTTQDFGFHAPAPYQLFRDCAGAIYQKLEASETEAWQLHYLGDSHAEQQGFLLGLALADYRYLRARAQKKLAKIQIHLGTGFSKNDVAEAALKAAGINLTRHLINTPANELNPVTYAKAVENHFAGMANTKVEVWTETRLKKENMGLILAVGKASATPPRLVKISYRPTKAKNQPIALVGKGITFDTGGLDIKPGAAMRLMKKDMGGSASVVGIASWLIQSKRQLNCDFYLAMAENAINEHAYRPGDVYTARSGLTVEIHNTDAEGRLVLADALNVAATQKGKNKPAKIINLATLTGAAKIALGMDLGALFATETSLAQDIALAGQRAGDHLWPLPLYKGYEKKLDTDFADTNHCSTGRFGGSITAALFLRKFVGDIPFAHLDIGAWSEKSGAIREAGANGQAVQAIMEYLAQQSQ